MPSETPGRQLPSQRLLRLARCAVQSGALKQRILAAARMGGLPLPGPQGRLQQRTSVRETQLPGLWAEPVHRIEIGHRLLRRLAAEQKIDTSNRRRHGAPQDLDCLVSNLGRRGLLLLLVVGDVFKVFNPRRLTEEVAHLSKAWA